MTKRTCSVSGCIRPYYAKGFCNLHWMRNRKHGEVFADRPAQKGVPLIERPSECGVQGCGRPPHGNGLCRLHYGRLWRYGNVFADRPSIPRVPIALPEKPQPQRERSCSIDGCHVAACVRGMCQAHYQRWYRNGDPHQKWMNPRQAELTCAVDGCEIQAWVRGWCRHHYDRWQRTGDPAKEVTRAPAGSGSLTKDGYRRIGNKFEHRAVMEAAIGRPLERHEHIHHKNGNRADNRIENLQLWTSYHPSGQDVEDVAAWCHEYLAKYEPVMHRMRLAALSVIDGGKAENTPGK
jgi:hypothetical protein